MKARLKRPLDAAKEWEESTERLREILSDRFAGFRLLVADDDPTSQAVALAGNEHEALIVMDKEMPVLDGLEATRDPAFPALDDVRIVRDDSERIRRRLNPVPRRGHERPIVKPVEQSVLHSTLIHGFLEAGNPAPA